MTQKTTLEQLCTGVTSDLGAHTFEVRSSITYVKPGDLPSADIFVMKINAINDPKQDAFQRIGSIVDLTQLKKGREAAIYAGTELYLTSSFGVSYTDVVTATKAKQLVQARVDRLISDWIVYVSEFVSPDTIPLPLTAASIVKQATDAYKSALTVKEEKDAELVAADAELALAEQANTSAAAALSSAASAKSNCDTNLSSLDSGIAAEDVFLTAVKNQKSNLSTYATAHPATELTNILAALQAAISTVETEGQAKLAALRSTASAQCVALGSALTAASDGKKEADTAVAEAQTAQTRAQAAATAAQADVDTTLAAVMEICPTFDPSSV